MPLNIVDHLSNLKSDYHSAIFFTYSLNLVFFEHIVLPKLESLGITRTLIVTDRQGYTDAIQHGKNHIRYAGRHYVCTAVEKSRPGVQHAKILMLLGETGGNLVIGSGNLTLHGFGRNLEVIDTVSYDSKGDSVNDTLSPFTTVSRLISDMSNDGMFDRFTNSYWEEIKNRTPWLISSGISVNNHFIHSYQQSIFSQMADQLAADELHIVSPYYNQQALNVLVKQLQPDALHLYLDPEDSYLDTDATRKLCTDWGCDLQIYTIRSHEQDAGNIKRRLHAKVMIGKHARGAWAIAGSANCTAPALLEDWQKSGNLELVHFQKDTDRTTFDSFLQSDDIIIDSLSDDAQLEKKPDDPSDESSETVIQLRHLVYDAPIISGVVQTRSDDINLDDVNLYLILAHDDKSLPVNPDENGNFEIEQSLETDYTLVAYLSMRDAAGIETGQSGNQFIHHVQQIQQYGSRSFHVRVRNNLTTFAGAESQFEELMNFLWERLDIDTVRKDKKKTRPEKSRNYVTTTRLTDRESGKENLSVERFYTEEDKEAAIWDRLQTMTPYKQDLVTLNDLLSLTLLKISSRLSETEDVQMQKEDSPEVHAELLEERHKEQQQVHGNIRRYIMQYCRRYRKQLSDVDFLIETDLSMLFRNHEIICRSLIEMGDKNLLFSDHLIECTLNIWEPVLGFVSEDAAALSVFEKENLTDRPAQLLRENTSQLVRGLFAILVAEAWRTPPSLQEIRMDSESDEIAMLGKRLIQQAENIWGAYFWQELPWEEFDTRRVVGYRDWADVEGKNQKHYSVSAQLARLDRIRNYENPLHQNYIPVQEWYNAPPYSAARKELEDILQQTMPDALQTMQRARSEKIKWLVGNQIACPHCYVELSMKTRQTAQKGKLALCTSCHRPILWRVKYSWE